MVFTSKNGIDAFFTNLKASGLDTRSLGDCKIAAIGEKTANYLLSYGIMADLVPGNYHSEELSKELQNVVESTDVVWQIRA